MGFDRRGVELEEQLKNSPLLADKERELLSRAFKDYLGKRNTCFEALLKIAQDDGTGDHASQWTQCLGGAADAVKTLGDALNSLSPPTTAADLLLKATAVAESKFFTALLEAKLGDRQDALLRYHRDLTSLTEALAAKWKRLLEDDGLIDADVQKAAQRIKDLYAEAATELVSSKTKLLEVAAKLVAGGGLGPTTAPAPLPSAWLEAARLAREVAKIGATFWLNRYSRYAAEVATIKGLAQSERGAIIVMFKRFREDTRDFMARNPLDKAVEAYDLARRDLDGALAATMTTPQKEDSKELVDDLLERFSTYVAMVRKDHDVFVDANNEKFWGPVGRNTKTELLEDRFWEDMGTMLSRNDLSAQLRAWRDEARRCISVDLIAPTGEAREELKAIISQDLEQMFDNMKKVEGILDEELADLFDREDAARELESG